MSATSERALADAPRKRLAGLDGVRDLVFPLLLLMVRSRGAILMVATVTIIVAWWGSWVRTSPGWTPS